MCPGNLRKRIILQMNHVCDCIDCCASELMAMNYTLYNMIIVFINILIGLKKYNNNNQRGIYVCTN